MTESFADLKKRSLMVNQEKPTRRFASGGAAGGSTKSKTVETTGRTAEREMQAMENRVAAAKPQRKAAGGAPRSVASLTPRPLAPAPLPGARFGAMSLSPMRPSALPESNPVGAPTAPGAKRGGRVQKGRR